jgi:hypothetical protein
LPCIARAGPPEAYLRLTTMVAETGQVDWGHFGHLQIGRARRALMAFVMVLSWSRQVFLQFFLDARMESFLRGHIAAFQAWNGLPRILACEKTLLSQASRVCRQKDLYITSGGNNTLTIYNPNGTPSTPTITGLSNPRRSRWQLWQACPLDSC